MKIDLYPLTELLEFIVDNRGKTVPTEDSGIVLIATNCIKNNELFPVFEKVRYLSRSTYENWFRAHPIPGDIIFVNKGTPGRVCFVPDPVNFCIAQDMIAFRANPDKIYNKYLLAALRSEGIQEQIGNMHVGTLIPHVKKSHLDKLLIPVPDEVSQRTIGDFYYNISYKIELNTRIIANLEAQAQAIFKSWFVDFEPFQDGEFEDSELGLIPKGWRVNNLLGIANYLNGLAMQNFRPDEYDDGLPVLKIKELRQGFCDDSSDRCTSNLERKYIVHDGDVIFSWSGSLLIDLWCSGDCGLNQHLFKVTSADYEKWFYYMWTKHHLDVFVSIAADKATTMGHIKREALEKALIVLPNTQVLNEANELFKPLIDLIILKRIENRKIALSRDTLLPKLMSGEIEVPVEG